jgi:hypothetical protein
MPITLQIAVGVVIGGIVLYLLFNFVTAYYSLQTWERDALKERLNLILGLPFLLGLLVLGFINDQTTTVMLLVLFGIPILLMLVPFCITVYVFRNDEDKLGALLSRWDSLPIIIRATSKLLLVLAWAGSGAIVYFSFMF